LGSRRNHENHASANSRNCQTSAASPAAPRDLPWEINPSCHPPGRHYVSPGVPSKSRECGVRELAPAFRPEACFRAGLPASWRAESGSKLPHSIIDSPWRRPFTARFRNFEGAMGVVVRGLAETMKTRQMPIPGTVKLRLSPQQSPGISQRIRKSNSNRKLNSKPAIQAWDFPGEPARTASTSFGSRPVNSWILCAQVWAEGQRRGFRSSLIRGRAGDESFAGFWIAPDGCASSESVIANPSVSSRRRTSLK